jgi:adenylate cyclase
LLTYRRFGSLPTLELEGAKSEYQRSYVLVALFIVGLLVSITNFFLLDANVAEFYGGARIYFTITLWLVSTIFYEILVLQYLKNKLVKKERVTTRFKFFHTFVEISFPSIILAYMIFDYKMLSFLDSPIMSIYYLFIILSILHLDVYVSIFTGVLAGIQYSLITFFGFLYVQPPAIYIPSSPDNSFYLRAIILMLCSVAAGFVSRELKNRIKTSFETKREKDELELLFDQQVSKEVSRALMETKGATKRLEATVMFLDIRNFTAFADSHTPDEVIDYQNKFISPIIDIINQHQGVVFQILGDGLMASFGSPAENVLHADMAFQASNQILRRVSVLCQEGVIPPTRIGIGLHSGQVVTGNIGNENRKQFSISGAPVIIASRLEQLNKKFNTQFLISHEVFQRIATGKQEVLLIAEEPLRGIETPVQVYKVC